ncbi:MAG TPA: AtpZ/AtpI family protein [Sphingomonadaceae bacterium]|nr:AtpZ/AtpI family protein [Sphingomonadaceae bacterium]
MADDRRTDGDELDRRIAEAKAAHEEHGLTVAQGRAESRGWAVGIEFVGAVLVSGLIGWAIDKYAGLGTAPWAMIVLLVLGFIAGTRRAMMTSKQFDAVSDDGDRR